MKNYLQRSGAPLSARSGTRLTRHAPLTLAAFMAASAIGVQLFGCRPSEVTFTGLKNEAMGNARVEMVNGTLVVSNLDSPSDGLAVDVGESEGMHWDLQFPPLPVGGFLMSRSIGQVAGVPDQPVSEIKTEATPDGFKITPNYQPIGAATFRMALYMDGVLVHQQTGMTGSVAFSSPVANDEVKCCNHSPHGWSYRDSVVSAYQFGELTLMSNGRTFDAENPQLQVDLLSRIEELASGISQFTVVNEFIMAFRQPGQAVGQTHLALGDATFQAAPGNLTVSNIGSSGDDGVSIGLSGVFVPQKVIAFNVLLDPVDLSNNGAALNIEATGNFDDCAGTFSGRAELGNSDGAIQVFASFETTSASNVRIAVFNAGVFQGVTTVPSSGVIGVVTGVLPRVVGCGIKNIFSDFENSLIVIWDGAAKFTAIDGTVLEGDQFLLLPANPQGTLNSLTNFNITAADMDSFVIVSESPVTSEGFPAICP